ncbi:hypothetical protein EG68_02771 [Paragonimus skrjabini miyazakii]|uniref:C2H2-type domain-containing protein n=1 Tax=Paragonimus skrjabini miyazakii TaxID=59628 RepID=A0A8S9YBW2_9TREM|nr:hypothetical protein EG68_02771 [Paragonimus skrjabini miyazakii]
MNKFLTNSATSRIDWLLMESSTASGLNYRSNDHDVQNEIPGSRKLSDDQLSDVTLQVDDFHTSSSPSEITFTSTADKEIQGPLNTSPFSSGDHYCSAFQPPSASLSEKHVTVPSLDPRDVSPITNSGDQTGIKHLSPIEILPQAVNSFNDKTCEEVPGVNDRTASANVTGSAYAITTSSDANGSTYQTSRFPPFLSSPITCVKEVHSCLTEGNSSSPSLSEKCRLASSSDTQDDVCTLSQSTPKANQLDELGTTANYVTTCANSCDVTLPEPGRTVPSPTETKKQTSIKGSLAGSLAQSHYCNLCGKHYRHGASLRNHMRKHASGALASKRYRCPHCVYSSQYNKNVIKHIEVTHRNLDGFLPRTVSVSSSQSQKTNSQFELGSPSWSAGTVGQLTYTNPDADHTTLGICNEYCSFQHTTLQQRFHSISDELLQGPLPEIENDVLQRTSCVSGEISLDCGPERTSFVPFQGKAYHCCVSGCNKMFKTVKYLKNHVNDCHRDTKPAAACDKGLLETQDSEKYSQSVCDYVGVRRNSLQQLLSPNRSDFTPPRRSTIVPPRGLSAQFFPESNSLVEGFGHNSAKQPEESDYTSGTLRGSNVRLCNSTYPTGTLRSNTADVYSFSDSNFHSLNSHMCATSNFTHTNVHDFIESSSGEHVNMQPMVPHSVRRFGSSLNSGSVGKHLPDKHVIPYSACLRNTQQSQSSEVSHLCQTEFVNVSEFPDGRCGEISGNYSHPMGCVQAPKSTVEQLLCDSDPSVDVVNQLQPQGLIHSHDRNKHEETQEDGQGVFTAHCSQPSDDSDFGNGQHELLGTATYYCGTSTADFDSIVQGQLNAETDAFFSDFEEILAREVPLFDNTGSVGDGRDQCQKSTESFIATTSTKSPPSCSSSVRPMNTVTLLSSGDSGLESWSSSSSCSVGPNSASVWGSQESSSQPKASPSSATPQSTITCMSGSISHDYLRQSTFDRCSAGQFMDEIGSQLTPGESENFNCTTNSLDSAPEDRSFASNTSTLHTPYVLGPPPAEHMSMHPLKIPRTQEYDLNYTHVRQHDTQPSSQWRARKSDEPTPNTENGSPLAIYPTHYTSCGPNLCQPPRVGASHSLEPVLSLPEDARFYAHPTQDVFQQKSVTRYNNVAYDLPTADSNITPGMKKTPSYEFHERPTPGQSYKFARVNPYVSQEQIMYRLGIQPKPGDSVPMDMCSVPDGTRLSPRSTMLRQSRTSYQSMFNPATGGSYLVRSATLPDSANQPVYPHSAGFPSAQTGAELKPGMPLYSDLVSPPHQPVASYFPTSRGNHMLVRSDLSFPDRAAHISQTSYPIGRTAWNMNPNVTACHPAYLHHNQQQQQQQAAIYKDYGQTPVYTPTPQMEDSATYPAGSFPSHPSYAYARHPNQGGPAFFTHPQQQQQQRVGQHSVVLLQQSASQQHQLCAPPSSHPLHTHRPILNQTTKSYLTQPQSLPPSAPVVQQQRYPAYGLGNYCSVNQPNEAVHVPVHDNFRPPGTEMNPTWPTMDQSPAESGSRATPAVPTYAFQPECRRGIDGDHSRHLNVNPTLAECSTAYDQPVDRGFQFNLSKATRLASEVPPLPDSVKDYAANLPCANSNLYVPCSSSGTQPIGLPANDWLPSQPTGEPLEPVIPSFSLTDNPT